MHSRTVEQVRSWDSRPFDGGLAALSALSEEGHTGAVTAANTWLFMLNGRVIGVFEGELEDFEASGTVYSTVEDGLPLLFAMQERGGRTRAKYFTEDTSLQEADQTLSSANFTGYVELSENVLSGDYYLVYYGGTRREVAFVGQSERVETGEAAFELAADEVGIYEVKDVSLTITEIPEPAQESQATAAATAGATEEAGKEATNTAEETTTSTAGPVDADATGDADQGGEPASSSEQSTASSRTADGQADEPPATHSTPATESANSGASSTSGSASTSTRSDASPANSQSSSSSSSGEGPDEPSKPEQQSADASKQENRVRDANARQRRVAAPGQTGVDEAETADDSGRSAGSSADSTDGDSAASADELERRFREEAEWRQTRSIPALDPEDTHPTEDTSDQPSPTEQAAHPTATGQADKPRMDSSPSTADQNAPRSRVEKLRAAVKKREQRIDELSSRIESLESERSELQSELEAAESARESLEADLESLREEREELADRVAELEAGADPAESEETLSAEAALAGTNLFVRYDSKGEPTLEALGEADPAAIDANLRLEHHTQFETDAVTVEGKAYREFLESTGTFAVLSWLLREFPYELLETGNRSAMAELFEAISAIDRIELEGEVTIDAEEGRTETFSFVMRDRMGNPLIVGEYDDSRDAVRESQLQALLSGAEAVAGVGDQFAGALYVTKSFFEPDALELAESSAARGGLLSRGEKASYVSPADGTGFHLALVEDRSQTFHVTVPKL